MSAVVVWLVAGNVAALEVLVVELDRKASLCGVEVAVNMETATGIALQWKLF